MKYLIVWAFVGFICYCYYDLHQQGYTFIQPTIQLGGSR